jgi:WD40 repeat protein
MRSLKVLLIISIASVLNCAEKESQGAQITFQTLESLPSEMVACINDFFIGTGARLRDEFVPATQVTVDVEAREFALNSKNHTIIACSKETGVIKIIDLETGKDTDLKVGMAIKLSTLSDDLNFILVNTDLNKMKLVNLQTKEHFDFDKEEFCLSSIKISPHNKFVIVCYVNKKISILNASTHETTSFTHSALAEPIMSSDDEFFVLGRDKIAKIISKSGELIGSITHNDFINLVKISPCNKYIVTYSIDKMIKITNIDNTTIFNKIQCATKVKRVIMSPDSTYFVAIFDNSVSVFNFSAEELIHDIAHTGAIYAADISPDSKYIVTTSNDGELKILNIHTQELVSKEFNGESIYPPLKISHNSKFVAMRFNKKLARVIELETGLPLYPQPLSDKADEANATPITIQHGDLINKIEISSNNEFILSGSNDNKAQIVNVLNGQKRYIMHGLSCRDVLISEDSSFAASRTASNITVSLCDHPNLVKELTPRQMALITWLSQAHSMAKKESVEKKISIHLNEEQLEILQSMPPFIYKSLCQKYGFKPNE